MEIEQTTKGKFVMLMLMAQNSPSCLANRKIDTCPPPIILTARNPPQQTCKAQGKNSMENFKGNHNTCNDTGRNGGERRIGTIPAGTDAAPRQQGHRKHPVGATLSGGALLPPRATPQPIARAVIAGGQLQDYFNKAYLSHLKIILP